MAVPFPSSQRAYSSQYWVDSSTTVIRVRASAMCSSSASSALVSSRHTTAAPAANAGNTSSISTSKPNDATWSQRSCVVSSSRPATAAAKRRSASRSITVPLGRPVEPEVNSTYATSEPPARRTGRAGSVASASSAGPCGTWAPAGACAPSPSHTAAAVRATSAVRCIRDRSRTVNPAPALSAASMPSTVRAGSPKARPTSSPGPAPRSPRKAAQASVSRSASR